MSRRIEVELTSARPDGTWTWRAAGAREPKGVVEGSLLPGGAKLGDVLRVDADIDIDGITILAVLPPKAARKEPELLQIMGSGSTFEPVTSTLVAKRDRPPRDRRDRSDRPRRDGEGGERRDRRSQDRDRPPRREGASTGPGGQDRPPRDGRDSHDARGPRAPREPRPRAERPPRPPVPMLPERPKPKRLKPGRVHRKQLLASLPDEQRPIAEQVLKGGVPAVREAVKEQNERLKAEGQPPIKADGMMSIAENLLPKVRVAEWLDRADAALADLDDLDLRDLRSVVTASADPTVSRDESTRDLATKLRDGLAVRQEKEHQEWLADIDAALGVGRVVRALRLSSRPPKAGVRFPPELGARLAEAAGAALTADAAPDRWGAVVEAVAYSPVRSIVHPAGVPTVTDELKKMIVPVAALVPEIAKQVGIEVAEGARPSRQPRRPPGPRRPKPPPAPKAATTEVEESRELVEPNEAEHVEPAEPSVESIEAIEHVEPAEPEEPAAAHTEPIEYSEPIEHTEPAVESIATVEPDAETVEPIEHIEPAEGSAEPAAETAEPIEPAAETAVAAGSEQPE